jgi:hypothetical protein
MPKIIIKRKSTFGLKSAVIEMFMDDKRIGYLPKGEIIEQEITPGEHKLKAKIGFYRSREIAFYAGNKETKSFTVSQDFKMLAIPLIIFFILIYASIRLLPVIPYPHYRVFFVQIPTVLFLVYLLTIGRNRQLKISEGE